MSLLRGHAVLEVRDVAERLAAAADPTAVGAILADACERTVPFAIFSYAVVEPTVSERPCSVLRSGEYSPAWLETRFAPMVLAAERDLPGGMASFMALPGACDLYERFPLRTIERTELWNEHWRPVGCSQHLAAPLRPLGTPAGFFAMTRNRRDARFTHTDIERLEAIRVQAERALSGTSALGGDNLGPTLDALSHAYPYPAFLFDAAGRLRWMSEEGMVRLGVVAARVGGGRIVRKNAALEALSRGAGAIARDPAVDIETALHRQGTLRRGERVAIRRFGESGSALLLLAVTPALAALPGEGRGAEAVPVGGLGAAESRVARLAAEGYTVLNISARLGVSESTVRTHLRRVYLKLGVHGRAELATRMLRGGPR
jgi:DNA-binding CsgD family transcriptional regulator